MAKGTRIESRLLEFHRFDDPDSGLLRKGDRYIALVGQERARQVVMPFHWEDFSGWMKELGYRRASSAPRSQLRKAVLSFLPRGVLSASGQLQQVDLVANVAEVAAIPFEAAISPQDPVVPSVPT
ncbi:MAG: hypothetical protein FJW40_13930 [Acidobacteria bacterium]|nr:hypothetical protein [Acidobacteriota bacterium]